MSELLAIKTQLDEMGRTWEQFKKENDQRLSDLSKKGGTDPLLTEKVEKMNSGIDQIADRLEKLEALRASVKEVQEIQENKAASQAFNTFLRKGEHRLTEMELKALTVQVDSEGGYTVRPEVAAQVSKKIFESSPMRQLASVMVVGSDEYQEIVDYSEPDAGWVDEIESRSETTASSLKAVSIPVHELHASPRATQKLLDDSSIDMEAWHSDKVAEKMARKEATAFVTGTGVKQPKGIMSYTAGDGFNLVQQVVSGSAAAITADGFHSVQNALFEAFQANAVWLMNRATASSARKLKAATTGEYLWGYGEQLNAGFQQFLLGKPVYFAADVAVEGAGNLVAAYGDFKQAYLIVEKPGMRVLRDAYTAKPYVVFYTTKRVGGGVRQFQAFKIMKCST